jgi:hypothetical protein
VAPLAGLVAIDRGVLECPSTLVLTDCSGGQFGARPSPSPGPYCSGDVLVTSANVSCLSACPCDAYWVTGNQQCRQCQSCPVGGNCVGGSLLAVAGHWGAADAGGTVEFAACPTDYCCDGSIEWPCSTPNSCAGNRTGALCGDCVAGYVESVGSDHCVPVDRCSEDIVMVWPVLVVVVLVAAAVQLTTVSGVWKPSPEYPSGKAKIMIFYAQARGHRPAYPPPPCPLSVPLVDMVWCVAGDFAPLIVLLLGLKSVTLAAPVVFVLPTAP